MKNIFLHLAILYFSCWYLNNQRLNNVVYRSILVPQWLKIILNPIKKDNEFDLSSIIMECYAHLSVLIIFILFLLGKDKNIRMDAWVAVSCAVFSFAMALFFGIEFCNNQKIIEKIGDGLLFLLCFLFSVFLVLTSILM